MCVCMREKEVIIIMIMAKEGRKVGRSKAQGRKSEKKGKKDKKKCKGDRGGGCE